MNEYDKQAQDFLDKAGIKFSTTLIGSDCPKFCEDAKKGNAMNDVDTYPRRTHIHGKHYRCTFVRGLKTLAIDFWNSYADEEQNCCTRGRVYPKFKEDWDMIARHKGKQRAEVTPYDVLTCIQKYDPGTFEDFCSDCGYDTDITAERVYHAVVKEYRKNRAFFTPAELEALQEIN